jgi:hypothetical protein
MNWTKTAILLACCALLAGCDPRTNEAHKAVADMLIDPASAQFRNDAYNSKTETTCGEVNAKNRMGGYIGFGPYVHMNLGVTYISSGPPDFEEYFRDSRPYSEYTTRRAIDKLFDACFFMERAAELCPANIADRAKTYLSNCKLVKDGGQKGEDELRRKLGIY